MKILRNILGLAVSVGICWLLSGNRKAINWKKVATALGFEFLIALIVVKIPLGIRLISWAADGLTAIVNCGNEGLDFVFGDLDIFIVRGLGNIIFLSALINVLYYLGIISFIVKWIGKGVGRLLGTSEVESFVSVANMFLGHTDSPILVARYLPGLTDSEIFVMLVSGMGSMSAAILGGYAALGIPMRYLLVASALVPAGSVLVSKILLPQTEEIKRIETVKMDHKGNHTNVVDALSEGAHTGIHMVIAIAASLVAFLGVVALLNILLGWFSLSLEEVFGYLFRPFSYLLGLEGDALRLEGILLGQKLILNEFIAFGELATWLPVLDARTAMVCAISLCGFANISSMGMCIGSVGTLCPEKKGTVARLVFKAMIGGMFVSLNSAFLVSIASLL